MGDAELRKGEHAKVFGGSVVDVSDLSGLMFFNFGHRRVHWLMVTLLLCVVGAAAATGCGSKPGVARGEATPGFVHGAVFVDRDGDGALSADDEPVAGVTVRLGASDVRFDTRWVAETNDSGGFSIEPPLEVEGNSLFVEVLFALPRGTNMSVRRAVAPDVAIDIALPSEPRACGSDLCDDRLLPDLIPILESDAAAPTQPLPPESWYLDTDTTPTRTLLRFSSAAVNVGDGPLDIVAGQRRGDGLETFQRIWTGSFRYHDEPAGTFVFHRDHDHIHLDAFERYRLLDGDGRVVASSEKVSFCLVDSWRVGSDNGPNLFGVWTDEECGTAQQAINVGWADYYGAELADQWIDVTGVIPGRYRVEITVDPDDVIVELDESNNVATFDVEIP